MNQSVKRLVIMINNLRSKYWSDLAPVLSKIEWSKPLTGKEIKDAVKIMGSDFPKFKKAVANKPKPQPFDWSRYDGEYSQELTDFLLDYQYEWRPATVQYLHDKYPEIGQLILDIDAGEKVKYEDVLKAKNIMGKDFIYLVTGKLPPRKIREYA